MHMEIETKLKVEDHEPIRRRLRELNATHITTVREHNHIFDDSVRSLLAADKGLRVRYCEVEAGRDVPATMTYKGPRAAQRIKRRAELETTIGDARIVRQMLSSLGFHETISFEKRRETWRLDPCLIELDELPHLGLYVEIEGPDEKTIEDICQRIGLAGHRQMTESYIKLLTDYCRAAQISTQQLLLQGHPARAEQ